MSNNRIEPMFERCQKENRRALILYLTSGFPNEEATRKILPILEESGCDLIELGVPFSDPIADGPTIQKASTVALNNGMTFSKTLEILRDFRQSSETPVILFGSINPFMRRGLEKSAKDAAEAGADGFLAADLPTEESDEFRAICDQENLHLIPLISPTTSNERIAEIGKKSSGFLYCMSLKGITGARSEVGADVGDYLKRVREHSSLPIGVGFGISTPEQVKTMGAFADGIVVGSRLISNISEAYEAGGDWESKVRQYVESLSTACRLS